MLREDALSHERSMPTTSRTIRQRLLVEHAAASARPRRAGRRAIRFAVIAGASSVLAIGGTAAAYVAFKPASTPVADQTRCYSTASLKGGDTDFSGTTVGLAHAADGSTRAAAAVDLCAALWRQGILQLNSPVVGAPSGDATAAVPALVTALSTQCSVVLDLAVLHVEAYGVGAGLGVDAGAEEPVAQERALVPGGRQAFPDQVGAGEEAGPVDPVVQPAVVPRRGDRRQR